MWRLWVLAALAVCPAGAAEARDFQIVADPDQTAQIEQSLAACPSLEANLDVLVRTSGLRQIRVTTSAETQRAGPFRAAVSDGELLLASDWLAEQKIPYFDVRTPGEILPDNLCFGLGHLAEHLAHPTPPPAPGADIKVWVDARMRAESLAFLHAWPYVLEAAKAKNGGKPLTGAQAGLLMLNLRYRFAFLSALGADASPKLDAHDDGEIPDSETNIAAISAALAKANIADLQ